MLILFCISLLLGAVLFHSFGFSILEVVLVGALLGAFFVLYFRSRKALVLGLAILMSICLGALRLWVVENPEILLGNRAFTGVIKSVDQRLDRELLVVKVDQENFDVQATLYSETNFLPGDKVSVRGIVEKPEDFVTETGRTFDYDGYLESRGVEAVMRRPTISLVEIGSFSFTRLATQTRIFIASTLSRHIVFPVDGIVAGMLVGFQGAIPKYLSDIFRDTGTLHTLVLSGYNITLLAGFLGLILRRLPFRIKTVLIGVGIAGLVLISGAGVAAVRAGIMGSIALFAGMTLQNYQALRALVISGLFFFFLNPKIVFVDPGLHLSFLATLFIITILPILKNKFAGDDETKPKWKTNLIETVILAVGLPIFMLPYMMYFSGLFPLVSPIANIVLVPIIPVLMLGGLVTLAISFIPFLAGIFGGITSVIGEMTIKLLTSLSTFPQWQTPSLPAWCVVSFYVVLFTIIFRKNIKLYFAHLRNIFQLQTN